MLMFVSVIAIAQQKQQEFSKNVKKEVEILQKTLNISDIQASRVGYVLAQTEMQTEKQMKALEGNKSAFQIMLKEIHDIKLKNIKGSLTDLQKQQFEALKLEDKF
jgi:hypothetical protein